MGVIGEPQAPPGLASTHALVPRKDDKGAKPEGNNTLPIVLGACIPIAVAVVVLYLIHRRNQKRLRREAKADLEDELDYGLAEQRKAMARESGRRGTDSDEVLREDRNQRSSGRFGRMFRSESSNKLEKDPALTVASVHNLHAMSPSPLGRTHTADTDVASSTLSFHPNWVAADGEQRHHSTLTGFRVQDEDDEINELDMPYVLPSNQAISRDSLHALSRTMYDVDSSGAPGPYYLAQQSDGATSSRSASPAGSSSEGRPSMSTTHAMLAPMDRARSRSKLSQCMSDEEKEGSRELALGADAPAATADAESVYSIQHEDHAPPPPRPNPDAPPRSASDPFLDSKATVAGDEDGKFHAVSPEAFSYPQYYELDAPRQDERATEQSGAAAGESDAFDQTAEPAPLQYQHHESSTPRGHDGESAPQTPHDAQLPQDHYGSYDQEAPYYTDADMAAAEAAANSATSPIVDEPDETDEERARRIRSVYREYFASQAGSHNGQSWNLPHRGAMTPPPRLPQSMPLRIRTGSANGKHIMGGPREMPSPPPLSATTSVRSHSNRPLKPLENLPTPSLLGQESDFFAPQRKRGVQRSESQARLAQEAPLSPILGGTRELPTPHMLRKSSTFTSLDFAPPQKFRNISGGTPGGSVAGSDVGSMASTGGMMTNSQSLMRLDIVPDKPVRHRLGQEPHEALRPAWEIRESRNLS